MSNYAVPTLIKQACHLVEARTGIAVHTQLQETLEDILFPLSETEAIAYLNNLESRRETDPIWQKLIEALTIGETYFLRDESHFELLRTRLLPTLIAKQREEGQLEINLWSVGCATGEEPYSLAITLQEMLEDIADWTINIIGTDINGAALHTARRGVYRKWAFRHTDMDFQGNYFDQTVEGLQIKSHIQRMVSFRHANLFENPPLSRFDLILARNVLLYFSDEPAKRAEGLFYSLLSPGGWLVLGASEVIRDHPEQWIEFPKNGSSIYQKPMKSNRKRTSQLKPVNGAHTIQPVVVNNGTFTHHLNAYEAAMRAIHHEAYDGAETLLSEMLSQTPSNAPARLLMAYILANRDRRMDAHTHLDMALNYDPLLADAHYLRALLYTEDGKTQDAINALRAAIYCQRNHPLASFMLGNLNAQAGEIEKAIRHWENARRAIDKLQPDSPVSDISDMTAGQLRTLVSEQIEGWRT
jgi:chemotaxis protein methyltransferase CheR